MRERQIKQWIDELRTREDKRPLPQHSTYERLAQLEVELDYIETGEECDRIEADLRTIEDN